MARRRYEQINEAGAAEDENIDGVVTVVVNRRLTGKILTEANLTRNCLPTRVNPETT